jgi:hypothetical protein
MPARSKSQQRLFGMVHAYQKGKLKDAPESIKEIARSISDEDAEHFAKTKHKELPEKKAYTQSPPTRAGEKNTLFSETARAAWADLTRTHPRDRTAADLSPGQQAAFAKAWSVDGDGIYRYNAYETPASGPNSNAFSPGYWFSKDPNHQVEKLFGRGTASWSKDGDLVFNDTYDLDFGGKNLPGVPTNADPDDVKIRSRISARALGLDPRQMWETANSRIQKRWAKLEPVMDKVYRDVQSGSYKGQVDLAIQEAKGLQARYNRLNSGPYRPEAASTLATWKDPYSRNLEEFGKNMDQTPAARIHTGRSPGPTPPPTSPAPQTSQTPQTQPSPRVSTGYGQSGGIRKSAQDGQRTASRDAMSEAYKQGFMDKLAEFGIIGVV